VKLASLGNLALDSTAKPSELGHNFRLPKYRSNNRPSGYVCSATKAYLLNDDDDNNREYFGASYSRSPSQLKKIVAG